jgi:hypothetical protein
MSEALARRLDALTGLALAAAVALWWLGSTRLAIDHGSDTSRSAASALRVLWVVRGMAVAILAVRLGALRGWRPGAAAALAVIAPSWPVVVLAWAASSAPWTTIAAAECALLAAGLALPLIGAGLRRMLRSPELTDLLATALGATLGAALWFAQGLWTAALS